MCSLLALSFPLTSFAKRQDFKPNEACLADTHQIRVQGCMRNGSDSLFPLKKKFLKCFVNETGQTVLEMSVTYRTHGTQDSCAIITKEFSVPRICADSPDLIRFIDTDNHRVTNPIIGVNKANCSDLRY